MTPARRVALFMVGLAAVFATSFGVGAAVGPWDEPTRSHDRPGHDMDAGE